MKKSASQIIRNLEMRVARLEKNVARKEMVLRIASIKLAEKSAVEAYKKIAPSYKNKKTKREVSWYTAYQSKDHPNHKQALADYQKWVSQNKAQTEKMKKARKKAGQVLAKNGKVIAEKSWSGIKKFLDGAKDEVMDIKESFGIIGRMTGITKDKDGNKYDFKNKEQLKEDMKTVWGSAVYLAGAAVTVYTGTGATKIAGTVAMDFGKSVASHALLKTISPDKGKKNFDSGPFSFLSVEAAETVSKAIGKGDSVLGGLKSTDLFDGIVKAIGSGINTIASEDEETDEDKAMIEFLGKINEAIGKAMQEMSDEEIDEALSKI